MMNELRDRVAEVRREVDESQVAFNEFASAVLDRADQFLSADTDGTGSNYESLPILQEELSETIARCRTMRRALAGVFYEPISLRVSNPSSDVYQHELTSSIGLAMDEAEQTLLKLPYKATPEKSADPGKDLPHSPDPAPEIEMGLQDEHDHSSLSPPDSRRTVSSGYMTSKAVDRPPKPASSNVFSVKLRQTQPLRRSAQTKLDEVEKIFCPSPNFDSADVSFKPPCDGVYALNVEMCQWGQGEISVCLCSHARVSYVGKTTGHMQETSVMKVKQLTRGQSHWIEVKALDGDPAVRWCNFSGFLISG